MTQLALYPSAAGIRERFNQYHQQHPEVAQKLAELAFEVKQRGFKRYGIKGLFERLRWHYHIERGDDAFMLNNSLTAHYARLLMEMHPELAGFFETREIRAN
jgi:hypothetical protein